MYQDGPPHILDVDTAPGSGVPGAGHWKHTWGSCGEQRGRDGRVQDQQDRRHGGEPMIRVGSVGRPLQEDAGRVVVYVPRPRGTAANEMPAFPAA